MTSLVNILGGVIILAVLIFYKKKAGLRPWFAPETSAGDPGWALFLSTVGAIVAVVNGIVIGISVNRYSYRNLEKRKSIFGICAQGQSSQHRPLLLFIQLVYTVYIEYLLKGLDSR